MFYAVAIGREQKITESWEECRKLTKGYSGAKFKKHHTYEEAERYIETITEELNNLLITDYEQEHKLIQSFTNGDNKLQSTKTELYIVGQYRTETKIECCPVLKTNVKTTSRQSLTVCSLISTHAELNLEEDMTTKIRSGDYRFRNYSQTTTVTEIIDMTKQTLSLIHLTEQLRNLYENGITVVNIHTDSNYLLHIIKEDIINKMLTHNIDIVNKKQIEELYKECYKFEYIFISHYIGKVVPDKMKYIIEKVKDINERELNKSKE